MKIFMSICIYNYAFLYVFINHVYLPKLVKQKLVKQTKTPKDTLKRKKHADKSIYLNYKNGFMIFKP